VLVVAYVYAGQGAGCQNTTMLQEISRVAATFVMGADWQMQRDQFLPSRWLNKLGASIAHSPFVDAHCAASEGSIIDDFVCANAILPMLGIDRDT
jgi:hypothetical protein